MSKKVVKRRFIKLVAIMIAIMVVLSVSPLMAGMIQYGKALAEDDTQLPVIINASWKAEPGGAIGIYGDGFGSMNLNAQTSTEVAIQPLTGFSGPLSPERATYRLSLINVQNNVIQGVIPDDFPADSYALWVKNNAGWSKPAFVNKTEIFWASEHLVYPGQKVRIFGRNFENILQLEGKDINAALKLVNVNDNSMIDAEILDISQYTIDFEIPAKVDKGEKYSVMVTNGAGGDYGWSRMEDTEALTVIDHKYKIGSLKNRLGLDAAWIDNIPHNNFINVKSFNAKGDGQTDDTRAIQSALDEAKQKGGGIVYLPEGTYLFAELNIPANTVLLGESKEKTLLRYKGGRTPSDRVGNPDWIYGEPIFLIYSKGDYVGLANLSIFNDEKRPVSDTMRRLNGWVLPVAFGYDSEFKTGDGIPKNNRGYFLKNVSISNVDGAGVDIHAISDIIIEDSEIQVTHGAVNCYADGYVRIRNNTMSNTQRPLIIGNSKKQWIEGNTLIGKGLYLPNDEISYEPPTTAGTQEHRYMDLQPEFNYVANNRGEGAFGSDKNDGEGICFQGQTRLAYSRVSHADNVSIMDNSQSFSTDSLQGAKLVIIGGRGIGQMRTIKTNSEHRIEIDKPWQVVPDNTSVYTIDKAVNYHNIIVGNQLFAKLNKAAVMFYTKDYDNIVCDNAIKNSGGIWMSANQVPSQKRADFSYFAYIKGNEISGAANPEHGEANHVVIGPFADGGRSSYGGDMLHSTVVYGNEYRENRITGIGTDVESLSAGNGWNIRYVTGSGIDIASIGSPSSYPFSQGVLVESNQVKNTIAGVHLGNTSYDTLLKDNDFEGNGTEIDNINSVNTISMVDGRVFPASPSELKAAFAGEGNVNISWKHALRAETYSIARSQNLKGPYQLLAEGITDNTFIDNTANGKPYYYRLIAKNAAGESIPNYIKAAIQMEKVGAYDTEGRSLGVSVSGDYAYLADNTGGLKIFDISNPKAPSLIKTFNTNGKVLDVQVRGSYAYLAVQGDAWKSSFLIIDIANPEDPILKGSVGLFTSGRIAIKDNYAFVADGTVGIRIIDISSPDNPVLKVSISAGNVADVFVKDDYMYAVNGKEFKIFDISNPIKPVLINTTSTRGISGSGRVFISGNYAYIADGTQQKTNGMQIMDVSDPANPTLVTNFDSEDGTISIYVNNNYAFLGGYFGTMRVLSVADPHSPETIGTIDTGNNIYDIDYDNEYLYLANSYGGLSVIGFSKE